MLTIKKLRQNGFKTRIRVYRYSTILGKKLISIAAFRELECQEFIQSKGGRVEICAQRDGKTYLAESLCSVNDGFNKREGLKIALERLEKQIEEKVS